MTTSAREVKFGDGGLMVDSDGDVLPLADWDGTREMVEPISKPEDAKQPEPEGLSPQQAQRLSEIGITAWYREQAGTGVETAGNGSKPDHQTSPDGYHGSAYYRKLKQPRI